MRRKLRHCLVRFRAADGDKDGALFEEEVAQCLKLAEIRTSPSSALSSNARCDSPIEWEVQKHIIGGSDYLVDVKTKVGIVAEQNTSPESTLPRPTIRCLVRRSQLALLLLFLSLFPRLCL